MHENESGSYLLSAFGVAHDSIGEPLEIGGDALLIRCNGIQRAVAINN